MARSIDHLVHAVGDLDAAARAYEDAGFTVTPRADHPFGTSNRLIVLGSSPKDGYIEIVSITRPELIPTTLGHVPNFARAVEQFLAEGPGIGGIAIGCDDTTATATELQTAGFAPVRTLDFSRPAPQPDGTTSTASFTLLFPAGVPLQQVLVFFCRHHTPEAVWNPASTRHANGAEGFETLTLRGDVHPAAGSALERLFSSTWNDNRLTIANATIRRADPTETGLMFLPPRRRDAIDFPAVTLRGPRQWSGIIDGLRIDLVS